MTEEKSAAKLREERLFEKQRLAEQARIANLEEKMDNRIFELKKTLAQTSDPLLRTDLQHLIFEEEQKRERYYEQKYLAEEAKILHDENQQIQIDFNTLEEQVAEEISKQMKEAEATAHHKEELASRKMKSNRQTRNDRIERWRQEDISGSAFICVVIILFFLVAVFFTYKQAVTSYRSRMGLASVPGHVSSLGSSTSKGNDSSSIGDVHTRQVDYQVQVDIDNLTIRSQPSSAGKDLGMLAKGVHAISGEVDADGYTWGRLKSGRGWIALDYTTKVVAPDLSDHSVPEPSPSQKRSSSRTDSSSSKPNLNDDTAASMNPQYKSWVSTYGNWTASIVYTLNNDGTATVRTSGGTLKYKVHFELPQEETKVWGLVLDDNGTPQEPKEYLANAVFTLEPLDGGPSQTLYGVLLKNDLRELTSGEYSEHPNAVFRGGSKNTQINSSQADHNSSNPVEEEE